MQIFRLTSDYIELVKLLKLLKFAESGGHAKILVEEGEVFLNKKQEFRKRAKLRDGDEVEVMGEKILIQKATF
jgi:ribosome-associated protein